MTIGVNTGSTIQASQIRTEFGASASNNGVSLGNYRLTKNIGELSLPLDEGVPTSGAIKMSDFSQKSLNVVVNVHSGGVEYGVNAKAKYNSGQVTVVCPSVGGQPTRGKKQGGSKIIIHCNKKLGAVSNPGHNTPQTKCALKTGTWSNPTHVHVILGGEANVRGSGGKGGDGKNDNSGSAQAGAPGSSGLGIEHEGTLITLKSGSQIVRGSGGGGGGGHATETSKNTRHAAGSGGGGGAGFPPGTGGEKGTHGTDGVDGENGTELTGGEGGPGRDNAEEAFGGRGGNGGSVNGGSGNGTSGASGNGRGEGESEGGPGGPGGAAIRKSVGHFHIIANSGTITGPTNRTGVT